MVKDMDAMVFKKKLYYADSVILRTSSCSWDSWKM